MTMKKFDVHQHTKEGCETVKHGFSWPGFFLTVFWAFHKRLWPQAIIGFMKGFIVVAVPPIAQFEQQTLSRSGFPLILGLIFGFNGNDWRRKRLSSRGWSHVLAVYAGGPERPCEH